MKFSLVFENSGDTLPFEVKYNHELFEFFVDQANKESQNSFLNHRVLQKEVDQKITHLHWALSKSNEVLHDLIGVLFNENTDLLQYLDQDFLNKTHCDWVKSQSHVVDIDKLRFSSVPNLAKIGNCLHNLYPDDERFPSIASVLEKLGYIYPYEEINMGIHRLEMLFNKNTLEFKSEKKWQIFNNPYQQSMITNNDIVNFSFGYTYVGRQLYNKFVQFDTELKYTDHYNYEQLEFAFQLTIQRPQTIPFSVEALNWAQQQGVKLVAEQIPIANLENLENNLFDYRKIVYRNSKEHNPAKIFIRG